MKKIVLFVALLSTSTVHAELERYNRHHICEIVNSITIETLNYRLDGGQSKTDITDQIKGKIFRQLKDDYFKDNYAEVVRMAVQKAFEINLKDIQKDRESNVNAYGAVEGAACNFFIEGEDFKDYEYK